MSAYYRLILAAKLLSEFVVRFQISDIYILPAIMDRPPSTGFSRHRGSAPGLGHPDCSGLVQLAAQNEFVTLLSEVGSNLHSVQFRRPCEVDVLLGATPNVFEPPTGRLIDIPDVDWQSSGVDGRLAIDRTNDGARPCNNNGNPWDFDDSLLKSRQEVSSAEAILQNKHRPWPISPSPVILLRGSYFDRPYDDRFARRLAPLKHTNTFHGALSETQVEFTPLNRGICGQLGYDTAINDVVSTKHDTIAKDSRAVELPSEMAHTRYQVKCI